MVNGRNEEMERNFLEVDYNNLQVSVAEAVYQIPNKAFVFPGKKCKGKLASQLSKKLLHQQFKKTFWFGTEFEIEEKVSGDQNQLIVSLISKSESKKT